MTTILEEARALVPALRAIKADLHRHPELSFAERRTTRVIRETLLALDWSRWRWTWRLLR